MTVLTARVPPREREAMHAMDEPAPPQPPLRTEDDPPLVVDGIEGDDVRPGDLAAFRELFGRFQARVEKGASGRKYRPLRVAWEDAAAELVRAEDRVDLYAASEKVVDALRLGCESARVATVDACLDCIHRLFEYGHVGSGGEGTDIVLDDRPGALDELVAMVCGCLEVKEEEVYLRMVQTLLTAATRTKSGLHHGTLLAAVRTIYNIYLNAKMPATRTTARVSLTQILNLVFGRMEAETAEDTARLPMDFMPTVEAPAKEKPEEAAEAVEVAEAEEAEEPAAAEEAAEAAETVEAAHEDPAADGEVVSNEVDGLPNGEVESAEPPRGQDVPEPVAPPEDGGDATSEFATVLQKDAYLLFRALCKLSAKDVPDGSAIDSVGIRSKLLSLELLRNLVSTSGPAFRSGERFIYALRQYLAPSLLTNCMSSAMEVVDLSLDIFEMLLRKETLRPLLKTEIGALFDTVIFRFLESHSAGPARRRRAMALLNRLSGDRQTMADLFLNYDCDMESPKIFEHIVNALSAAAEEKSASAGGTSSGGTPSTSSLPQPDFRITALSSVVQIVRSLRNWSKPIEDSKEIAVAATAAETAAETTRSVAESTTGSPLSASAIESTNGTLSLSNGSRDDATNGATETGSDFKDENETSPSVAKVGSEISRVPATSGAMLGVVSEGSDRDTARFEEALRAKRASAEGIVRFNSKPKRGIEYLVANGRLEKEFKSVAAFLHRTEGLDATMVGEYIGEGDAFSIGVMHAYTDMNDFTDLTFDGALRMHLGGFRLPGEAQKIDRIMEKYASRYCECNPGIFANADAAYVLAYSSIMLHTDAHNATIKQKMNKEEFIRNNRGINDGGDLDPTFLSGLYDRITTTEIRLTGSLKDSTHDSAAAAIGGSGSHLSSSIDPVQRARQFKAESERLMTETRVLFANRRRTAEDYTYYSATNVYHSRLMFESAWYPVLAAVSVLLEKASPSDTNIVALCLDGFRNGIAIASTFGMSTAKDAFVSSLAKFTHLNSISEMRPKNVECVRMILAIAALEGNNLGEQWLVIVRAISQLEQVRAVAAGNPGKYLLQKTPLVGIAGGVGATNGGIGSPRRSLRAAGEQNSSSGSGEGTGNTTTPMFRRASSAKSGASNGSSVPLMRIDSKAASMATTIAESEIERIFTNSSLLTAAGVADFCGALCSVALEELSESTGPRLFCLQKIVEMAYYNMESRTRLQWGKIWEQMGPFFAAAMCHSNRDVAMYSTDSLRQLASKFLDKDELSNFSFQRAFLKPFEVCFQRSKSVPIRELVLTCVSQIVLARASNIKSGWKSVFAVLALAADDKAESIMNFGFQIVDSILRKYLGVIDDVFVDAVTGIAAYTRTTLSTEVSLAAVNLLSGRCAKSLADGLALSTVREGMASSRDPDDGVEGMHSSEEKSAFLFSAEVDAHIGAWFPILTALSAAVQDDRPAIRMAASEALYQVLADHGGRFSPSLWALIFRGVLSPGFDDVRHLSTSTDRTESSAIGEWAATTGSTSLRSLVDVFVRHIKVTRSLLPELLGLLASWILQETEVVAREGMGVLSRLIVMAGELFENEDWQLVANCICGIFVDTMPHEILGPDRQASAESNEMEASSDTSQKASDAKSAGEPDGRSSLSTDGDSPASVVTTDRTEDDIDGGGPDSQKIDFRVVRAKCVVQLLLIQLVQDTVVSFYRRLSTAHILELSTALEQSYIFAHDFNADIELRYSLWRAGFMNQVPNLLKQETNGLTAYLRIAFWLYLDPKREDERPSAEEKIMPLCERVLRGYILSCEVAESKSEDRREVVALTPVVTFIVNSMMQMSSSQFEAQLGSLYGILLDLMEGADEREVRNAVGNLFRVRIAPTLRTDNGSADDFVAMPQIPGPMRDVLLAVESVDEAENVDGDIRTALGKVSGVRTTLVNLTEGTVHVVAASPHEMLISAVSALPKVRAVSLVQSSGDGLLS